MEEDCTTLAETSPRATYPRQPSRGTGCPAKPAVRHGRSTPGNGGGKLFPRNVTQGKSGAGDPFDGQITIFLNIKNAENRAKLSSKSPNSDNSNPKGGNWTWRIFLDRPLQNGFFRKTKNVKNRPKNSSRSPNSENSNPKGGNQTWRIFLDQHLQNGFFRRVRKC